MKNLKKSALLAATVALGLGLSACDSKKENAEETAAQNVREASEAAADAMETDAAMVRETSEAKADKMEDKADAVRATGDAKADKMEDQADKKDMAPE
jgi:hypothetical protein